MPTPPERFTQSPADELPAGFFPEPFPPEGYTPDFPLQQIFTNTNDTVLYLGVRLSRAGVNLADELHPDYLRTYISIAENPSISDEALGSRSSMVSSSMLQARSYLINRLHQVGVEWTPQPSEDEFVLPPREGLTATNENILSLGHRMADAGVDLSILLSGPLLLTYTTILGHPEDDNEAFSQRRGVTRSSVGKTKKRLLDDLYKAYEAYDDLAAKDSDSASLTQQVQTRIQLNEQLAKERSPFDVDREHGANIDGVRAMIQLLTDNGIDPRALLTPSMNTWANKIIGSSERLTDLARTQGHNPQYLSSICGQILQRLGPHIPEGVELPPVLRPPQGVGYEIGKLLVEHAVVDFAGQHKLDVAAVRDFTRGEATLSFWGLEAIMKALGISGSQASTFRQQYKKERLNKHDNS